MARFSLEEFLNNSDEEIKMSDKQKKILIAAIETFSEKGFAATSTSEIAKKAGVAEGTIFRHYKTKKDLLMSIVMPIAKMITPTFAKSFKKEVFEQSYQSFEEFVREIISNRFDFVKANFPVIKIFIQEVFFHEELQSHFKKLFSEHVYHPFKQKVEAAVEKGELVELPADTIIRLIVSSIMGLVAARFIAGIEMDEKEEIERTVQFVMRGIRKE
ncbi:MULTISPECIES: TetR/AcrR family transcriptional regulator [Bacillus]|uniref:TetR family transcriptional regulator n=2 Tax=Bacillus TaxID=1386 RepID=A0A0M4FE61_9BACI|nr:MULTISPECIES: TetR/AcrR family transcriptional regulator [Bacillus]ALC80387.1 TetR family transcriptional regulator [Bacillus gobiensis]MBP1083763.1 AcrR family transcriptional regulator [Bacillus capparidis]MED1098248.1 TetR/AcrR family transcriptional regulator [Bacillus capparidis]